MLPTATTSPTIFETTPVSPDDPILERPISKLPLDQIAEAARIVTAYPAATEIQKFRRHVVTLRITAEEFEELMTRGAQLRASEIVHAPLQMHQS